jgi:hypothetical protein
MTPWFPAAAIATLVLGAQPAYAQASSKDARPTGNAFPAGTIEGRVLDDQQVPVPGAMVSAIGRSTAATSTDRDGHYTLRDLPYGPYILSVHSRGYWQSRGRTIQLTASTKAVPQIELTPASMAKGRTTPSLAAVPSQPSPATQFAGFGLTAAPPESAPPQATSAEQSVPAETASSDEGETAWRLRHLPRSVLKDAAVDAIWTGNDGFAPPAWFGRYSSAAMVPIALFSELPLSGQFNLMTIESFDRPRELFGASAARSVAHVTVNTEAAGGAWAMQGAMTQGDLSSWIVAGSYRSIASANHAYELGMSYSTQRYDGGNVAALGAIRDNARNVGTVYGEDEWTLSPRFVLGYGTGYARYDYLGGPGLWSPHLSVTVPVNRFRVRALASRRAVVPGAEEFAPSVTGMWLPPERTFSLMTPDGRFTPEQTQHLQVSIERDLASGLIVSVRGFGQRVNDQLIEMFGVSQTGRPDAPVGHYFVATAGDVDARGWGVSMTQEVPGLVRAAVEYTVTTASWTHSPEGALVRGIRASTPGSNEHIYDLHTSVEATIPQTATRVYARYRMNSAFRNYDADAQIGSNANARFNIRVNQSLPFLSFSNADWEMLVDVRNLFRAAEAEASVYDEAMAIKAPKRIVGGLQVRF